MKSIEFKDDDLKTDFISVCEKIAISANGDIFKVGDKVLHEGDDEGKVGTISKFTVDRKSSDVVAHTEHGFGRIVFLYHDGEE